MNVDPKNFYLIKENKKIQIKPLSLVAKAILFPSFTPVRISFSSGNSKLHILDNLSDLILIF